MRMKLISLCLAAGALFACGAPAALASPLLTHPQGTAVPVGTKIVGKNVGNFTITAGSFNLACTKVTMTGTVRTNSGTLIEGNISSVAIGGTGKEEDCTSTIGDIKTTTSGITNGVPWCLKSGKTADTFELRGNECSAAARPIRFVKDITNLEHTQCIYERTAPITGTFKTQPEDALLTISEVAWVLVSGSFICPVEWKLDLSFTLQTDSAATEPIYIS
jgi:hypothetical protein